MEEKKSPHQHQPAAAPAQKVMKGTREYEHHLFRLGPAKMKKNISYKYKLPTIVEIEHEHIYHSIDDSAFEANEFSAPVGGHFHKVEFDFSKTDPRTGGPATKCGPPLHRATKFISGIGQVSSVQQIKFERHDELGGPEVDDHRHPVNYLDTEILSAHSRQELRNTERAKIQSAQEPGTASSQAAALSKTADGAEKGKAFVKDGTET